MNCLISLCLQDVGGTCTLLTPESGRISYIFFVMQKGNKVPAVELPDINSHSITNTPQGVGVGYPWFNASPEM